MFTYRPKIIRNLWCVFILLMMLPSLAFEQTNSKISLKFNNTEISSVLRSIETQSGYTFYFSAVTLDVKTPVSINVKQVPLEKVLDELLKPFKVSYFIKDKSIIIRRLKEAEKKPEIFSVIDTVPNVAVSGKVVDSKGAPMAGVTVSVKGKPVNSITDQNGDFKLPEVPLNGTLFFSSIGYERQELRIKGSTVISIALKERITDLEKVEVVSTGYQDIPKERATGSFVQIDNTLFNRRLGATILDRLIDIVPGLNSTSVKGTNINSLQIRGISTINADSKPLIIVDNFIYEGDLTQINPNDVESVTVLRDAAAASIWGVRAGNGVIVVTLKKGIIKNQPKLSFRTNIAITPKPDLHTIPSVSSTEIIQFEKKRFHEGFYNSQLNNRRTYPVQSQIIETLDLLRKGQITEAQANNIITSYEDNDIRTDAERYLLQNQVSQQYAISLTGGNDKYQYFSSAGYDQNRNIAINNKNDRITWRISNTWVPTNNLKINTDFNYTSETNVNKNTLGASVSQVLNYPYNSLVNENGEDISIPFKYRSAYVDSISLPGLLDWHFIPNEEAKNGNTRSKISEVRVAGNLSYSFLKYLRASAWFQYQKNDQVNTSTKSIDLFETRDLINKYTTNDPSTGLSIYPYPIGAIYDNSTISQKSWNIRGQLDFNKNDNDHGINGLIGVEIRESKLESFYAPTQYGFDPQTNTFQSILSGSWQERPANTVGQITQPLANKGGNINRFGSLFGNLSYSYKNTYTISASSRIDQSNFFGVKANSRIVPLWSTGFTWNISNEPYFRTRLVSLLKLRITYGYSGNVNAGTTPFATANYFQPAQPLFVPYAVLRTPPNPILKWEKVKQLNLAVDFGILNNKLSGSIEYYKKVGLDLISPIIASRTSGFETYTGNNSSLKTKGLDFTLRSNTKISNIILRNHFIFSYNTNKVTSYSNPPPQNLTPAQYSSSLTPIIGKPVDKIYTYNWGGLDPVTGGSQLYINDKIVSSSEVSSAQLSDLQYSGRSIPSIFGSFRSDISFKNLSFSIGLRYLFNANYIRGTFNGTITAQKNFVHNDFINAWKEPGDENRTNVPGFLNFYTDQRYQVYTNSSILIEKKDHIRLQDIKVEYAFNNIKSKFLTKLNGSLYLYINNLGVIWKASKYDPFSQNVLIANPNQPTFTLGTSLNL